jgi:hypothetical protein
MGVGVWYVIASGRQSDLGFCLGMVAVGVATALGLLDAGEWTSPRARAARLAACLVAAGCAIASRRRRGNTLETFSVARVGCSRSERRNFSGAGTA